MGSNFFLQKALLPTGWADNVLVRVSANGSISSVEPQASRPVDAVLVSGHTIAGMPNLHSHTFQRAMSGLTEYVSSSQDSFWSWRNLMYKFVAKMTPQQLKVVASQLYLEMVKAGYTSVAEFHYLHHSPDGSHYAAADTMCSAIVEAARESGIGLTLLPVLYMNSGFGGLPPESGQRRFIHSGDSYLKLIEQLHAQYRGDPQIHLGIAPHSLRAVTPQALTEVTEYIRKLDPTSPIHIHIAEQTKEVEDCVAWCGKRPVEWLLETVEVDRHWCLVHATHMRDSERQQLAASGAVAGICPTTEANLGDGFFPLAEFLGGQGVIGIGSDSNASVSPVEELRWLEYGQRLLRRQRSIAADTANRSVGRNLWSRCLSGGARATGRDIGGIAAGLRADLITLDDEHPLLVGREEDLLLDSYIFSGNTPLVKEVIIGGQRIVENGVHPKEHAINQAFRQVMKELLID